MKTTGLAVTIFVGSAIIGGLGYKAIMGCPKFAEVACIEQSRAAFEGGEQGFTIALKPISTQAENLQFEVTSGFTCPITLAVGLSLDRTTLPNWQLDNLFEAAYITPALVELENGKGVATFSAEDHPELKIVPAGQYIVTATVAQQNMSPVKYAYYTKAFNLKAGAPLLRGQTKVDFETSAGKDGYDAYLTNWLKALEIVQRGGITSQNLGALKALLGEPQKVVRAETVEYVFPKPGHTFFVKKADGALIEAFRYSHEAEE